MSVTFYSEKASICFNVLNTSYAGSPRQAEEFIRNNLQVTSEKADLLFTHVVLNRSTVFVEYHYIQPNKILHYQRTWDHPGPLSVNQILKMLAYSSTISNADWVRHLEGCVALKLSPKEWVHMQKHRLNGEQCHCVDYPIINPVHTRCLPGLLQMEKAGEQEKSNA